MRRLKFLMAGAVLAATAPASAITVTSIRITSALPNYIQVSELQAFQGGTNVALASAGATATGSGIWTAQSTPDKAIDGIITGVYPQMYHSDGSSSSEFLLVTLSQAYDITGLTIFGRNDSTNFRDFFNFTLFNGQSIVATGQLDARNAQFTDSATFAAAPTGAVPEPASWAMLIAGFGLTGGALRSRRTMAAQRA